MDIVVTPPCFPREVSYHSSLSPGSPSRANAFDLSPIAYPSVASVCRTCGPSRILCCDSDTTPLAHSYSTLIATAMPNLWLSPAPVYCYSRIAGKRIALSTQRRQRGEPSRAAHVVVLASLPEHLPLPDRSNVILPSQSSFTAATGKCRKEQCIDR